MPVSAPVQDVYAVSSQVPPAYVGRAQLQPLVPPEHVLDCSTQPVSTLPHFQVQVPVQGGGGGGDTHGVVVAVGSQIVGVPVGVEHGHDGRHGL